MDENSNSNNLINLSDESVREGIALCSLVARKSPTNETTQKMATGIAEYLEQHGFLSRKQAEWLARNADYHKQPRPKELRGIAYARKEPLQNQLPLFSNDDHEPDHDDLVLRKLVTVRRELDAVIDRLRA